MQYPYGGQLPLMNAINDHGLVVFAKRNDFRTSITSSQALIRPLHASSQSDPLASTSNPISSHKSTFLFHNEGAKKPETIESCSLFDI